MAPRATAACALAALLLALAASDTHASFFGFLGSSDDVTTDAPVVSTESSAPTSAARTRPSKKGSRQRIETAAISQGQSESHKRSSGKQARKSSQVPREASPASAASSSRPRFHNQPNATIVIASSAPKRVQEETTEHDPVETAPSQPPAPTGEQRPSSSIYPPTVITETVRMEDGQMVAHVDVPAEAPMVAGNGFRPISLADLQGGGLPDNEQSVWGPYPTELNSLPLDYTGMEQSSFPYGQNSLPPWWQTPPAITTARNSWYPMSQASYHPWRSSRLGLPPMMNPYTQAWLHGRGRRETVMPDPFEAQDIAEDDPSDPWNGYFGNAYYGYTGWPPYTPPMRMYVPPYAYPWGPVTTRWVSKPHMSRVPQSSGSNAAGQPPQPSPSPSPTHADSQTGTGAEQHRKQNGAQHHPHHMRHSKHRHLHPSAPTRLQPPPWMMPQTRHPSWPSVASLPQMLPMRPYMTAYAPARAPALSATGGAGPAAPPAPSPPPSPPSADDEDPEVYDD